MKLKKCPCGKTPEKLTVQEQGEKWAYCSPSCCGEWEIEFRNQYAKGEECIELAILAWNDASRGGLK